MTHVRNTREIHEPIYAYQNNIEPTMTRINPTLVYPIDYICKILFMLSSLLEVAQQWTYHGIPERYLDQYPANYRHIARTYHNSDSNKQSDLGTPYRTSSHNMERCHPPFHQQPIYE